MGIVVIVAYRPLEGKAAQLLEEVKTHVAILRSEGLATDREQYAMRAKDGSIIEVFEWVSAEAIAKAHENAVVREMWQRFEACSEYEILSNIPEIQGLFAGFEAIALE